MSDELELKRWTRKEYDLLIERGVFDTTDRIELIDGQLVVAEPQAGYHYNAITLVVHALAEAFGAGWWVRSQGPIALDDVSEPEPDVAVVRGNVREYGRDHPADPVLVVEVTLTSHTMDRRYKSSLYARAGRPEYWIVNLADRVVEVRRDPRASPAAPYGWDYADVRVVRPGERVAPLAAPDRTLAIDDLFPW
ncbi:MAG: Uma2 family endonuclease [Candidatus Rokubacteria bacterium]|nr:Uma2 family endonuclease [Candidatus Rokubacteria bacterium]